MTPAGLLDIGMFYWLLAAFLLYAAWRNARERRWTHAGLRRLFTENADWQSVEVQPGGGTASCLAMLLGVYTEIAFRRARAPQLAAGPVWLFNRAADALDRRVELLREPRPGSLSANFHVVATVGA